MDPPQVLTATREAASTMDASAQRPAGARAAQTSRACGHVKEVG
jgi:hypothetical protein